MWITLYEVIKNIIYICGIIFLFYFCKGLYIGILKHKNTKMYKEHLKNHKNGVYDPNCAFCRKEILTSTEGFRKR